MIEYPKLTGREFYPIDWYGWFMALLGCTLMYLLIQDETMTWPLKIIFVGTTILTFLDYVWRVAYGRVYKHVYYDTIIHNMYEVQILDTNYYICADDEDELKLYIDLHYPLVGEHYKIVNQAEVESYIKKELFQ